jgi:acid phosphatase family membrane protein YuiD
MQMGVWDAQHIQEKGAQAVLLCRFSADSVSHRHNPMGGMMKEMLGDADVEVLFSGSGR